MEMVLKAAIQTGSKAVLVPLTNSLYVSGELTSTETVLVDVGTGFMIEKVSCDSSPCTCLAGKPP